MKKITLILMSLFIVLSGCSKKEENDIPDESDNYVEQLNYDGELEAQIFTYGEFFHTDFNFEGLSFTEAFLVIGDTKLKIIKGVNGYTISDQLNKGFFLPSLDEGNYYFHVELVFEGVTKIYSIKDMFNFVFYPIRRNNQYKKILLKDNMLIISKIDQLPVDVYDIVIDPGHGGIDGGANNSYDGLTYLEKDEVLDFSIKLEQALIDNGFKVKLTRYEDEYPGNVTDMFSDGGRIDIIQEASPKLLYSIHLNSHPQMRKGFEVYTTSREGIIAQYVVDQLKTVSEASNTLYHKSSEGIYTRYLSQEDIALWQESLAKRTEEEKYEMFEILLTSKRKVDYYVVVRELGALATDAYEDGRRPDREANERRESIYGIEGVLLELAYIDNEEDFFRFRNNNDQFVEAVMKSIIEYTTEN